MKKTMLKLACLLLGVSLVACSTNTRTQNTAVGAGAGAVVGGVAAGLAGGNAVAVGVTALAGAVVGGLIGHNMDSSDGSQMNNTMNNTPTHHTKHWKNKQTGANYKVTPTSGNMTMNGTYPCRNYRATTSIHGQTETTNGTLCRQSNGNWTTANA